MSKDIIFETLVERFAVATASELKKLLANDNAYFDSKNLPPGVNSRAAFARKVKNIDGAFRVGKTWVVSQHDWQRHHSARSRRTRPLRVTTPWSPDGALASAGIRRIGGDK